MAKKATKPAETRAGTASACLDAIDAYEKAVQTWHSRGGKVIDRYRDERGEIAQDASRFNILWSNVQVLQPTLLARAPVCEVGRRFKDSDQIARVAGEIAERCTNTEIERSDLGETLDQAVLDVLLPGRGQIWVRYEATTEGEGTAKVKTSERVIPTYVDWKDFGHNVARTWKEVSKVWRRVYMTKAETERKWPDIGNKVEFTEKEEDQKPEQKRGEPQATFYEVWDKTAKQVYWVNKSVPDYLDQYDPPIDFQGFFPCPKPNYATTTNDTLIPIPDYCEYQDQALELDEITKRIGNLLDGLRLIGVYDESIPELKRVLDKRTPDNALVPVKNFSTFTGKGGLEGGVQWLPLSDLINALSGAYEARDRIKQVIYEVTGIADVLRGSTNPNETLGAQKLKAQFGSTRIKRRQAETARFARDVIRLMAEVICELYDPKTMLEMANAQSFSPADQQVVGKAIELLRSDRLRTFRVDIETDSTIALDEAEEKAARTEFLTALGGFLEKAVPAGQAAPALVPMLSEAMKFMARGYKAGRGLESAIEQAADQMAQQAAQRAQQPPPPDPKVVEAQENAKLEREKMGANAQLEQAKLAQKEQGDQRAHQRDMVKIAEEYKFKRWEAGVRMAADNEFRALDLESKIEGQNADREARKEVDTMRVKSSESPASKINFAFDGVEKMVGTLAEQNAANAKMLTEAVGGMTQAVTVLAKAAAAPQMVERDKSGKITGSRKVIG